MFIYGIIIFGDKKYDPQKEPWVSFTQVEGGKFQVFYLDPLFENLLEKKPDHPLVAVLYLFIEDDLKELEKNVEIYFNKITNSQLTDLSKERYIEVFIECLSSRFVNKS